LEFKPHRTLLKEERVIATLLGSMKRRIQSLGGIYKDADPLELELPLPIDLLSNSLPLQGSVRPRLAPAFTAFYDRVDWANFMTETKLPSCYPLDRGYSLDFKNLPRQITYANFLLTPEICSQLAGGTYFSLIYFSIIPLEKNLYYGLSNIYNTPEIRKRWDYSPFTKNETIDNPVKHALQPTRHFYSLASNQPVAG